jgi:hypothetical protein
MKKLSLLLIVMMSFVRIGFGQDAQVAAEDKAIGNVPKCFCCSEKIYKMPKPSIKGTDKICKDSKNVFNTTDCDGAKINWSLYPASVSFSGQGTSQITLDYASVPSGTPFVVITLELICGGKSVKNILKVPVCQIPVKLVIKEGEDAIIHQLASEQNISHGAFVSNSITNWTYGNTPAVTYSLIKFNLAGLTASDILSAKLVLTEFIAPSNGNHALQYGPAVSQPTDFEVRRVTSPWSASNVNWTNQPGATGAVTVIAYPTGGTNTDIAESPGSSGSVVVTQLVKDMLTSPNTNNGFMLRWKDNNTNLKYRSRWFGSFECPDPTKRPVLIIN